MDKKSMEEAEQKLLALRREVLREVQNARQASLELGQDGVPDIGDMSANSYSRELLLNLTEGQRRHLRDIDAALERIEAGEYGICRRCEEEIPPKRLEVRPFSRYCVDCKSEVEKFGED